MAELVFRFLIGGLAVSTFATLGDVLKPKSFAGLFGAAPSVAIATLVLTASRHGTSYAGVEATSMAAGALAFLVYACTVSVAIKRLRVSVIGVAILLLPIWFVAALGFWTLWLMASRRI
jgi:hypothetical protein